MDNAHQTKQQPAELIAMALDDGRRLWTAPCFENYDTQLDIFVIKDVVWVGDMRHKKNAGFTQGRDLHRGNVVATLPDNQQLYDLMMGHHRCYRNKATERFLLLGRDGIEFIDPATGEGNGNWWVRGTCQYGIMPANGLVYAPQHSCACHPLEKLIGFNALAPQSAAASGGVADPGPALERGPAYRNPAPSDSATTNRADWPTYRRDAHRSGYQDLAAPQHPRVAWETRLRGPLTAPVVDNGTVYVAETDLHTLCAVNAADGSVKWQATLDGRIDSPPTLVGGRCLVGTRGGSVYCLTTDGGELAWRFRAGPQRRLLMSYEQLESAWPVHGSVLVAKATPTSDPLVYFAAGRSSHLDGGIYLNGLELQTGNVVYENLVTTATNGQEANGIPEPALPDVLSLQGGSLFMRHLRLTLELARQDGLQPHLFAPAGFLDDSWWHRTYWMFGTSMRSGYGGWPQVGNLVPAGRLLVMDEGPDIYGYSRMAYRAGAGHVHADAAGDFRLFSEKRVTQTVGKRGEKNRKGQRGRPTGRREIHWAVPLPFVATGLVLTPDALITAGDASLPGTASRGSGTLLVASRSDGHKLAECQISAAPVVDGMAYARAGVFIAGKTGSLICVRDDSR